MRCAHEHARAMLRARVGEVSELVAIPSVSGDDRRHGAVEEAAAWLRRRLERAGLHARVCRHGDGAPLVRAAWSSSPPSPTVLFYGHYDVQPAEPRSDWRTNPFVPAICSERLYGRGATDDKGPVLALIAALESILATRGDLPVNAECVFEGEDEVGSSTLLHWLARPGVLPAVDVAIIADTPMRAVGHPALTYALRGRLGGEILIRGLDHDVHCGVYGGAVPDAARELAQLLASLHDARGAIAVAGLYDGLVPLSAHELAALRRHAPSDTEIRRATGARALPASPGATGAHERSTLLPSITITSLSAGAQGSVKSVVPATARARFDVRLPFAEDPYRCATAIRRHLQSRAPAGLETRIDIEISGRPCLVDRRGPLLRAAARALGRAYGSRCALLRSGGSVPVAEALIDRLRIPTLLLGTTPPESGMHEPNEYLHLPSFDASIHAVIDLIDAIPGALHIPPA